MEMFYISVVVVTLIVIGALRMIFSCFHKVSQGSAMIRNGLGGSNVSFSGMVVFPIIHWSELMDISVRRIEVDRRGKEGLICRDNLRADVKVVFFVRVNNSPQSVLQVAQSIGCRRASDPGALVDLFDAKFSEALKTVGKKFAFVDLYTARDRFKEEILKVIGTDLNGYVLDDCAIDYLEQTPLEMLNPNNILDAEGIKTITDLTAKQAVLSNDIQREKEKTITQQDVRAREAILEMKRSLAEAEEKQKREIAAIKAREEAEAARVQQEERLKSERARIVTEEEIAVAEQNRDRQIIVAQKNKERTEAIEIERVAKDRSLEATERERVVALATIDKAKAIETEQKNIQDVIRQRVQVQRAVVEEEERIKDTREFAAADRSKKVVITKAEMEAEEALTKEIKAAEAAKKAAVFQTEQRLIEAEAGRNAAEKEAAAKKILAEASAAESAATGLGEAKVLEAKAAALEKQGTAEARVLEAKAVAAEKQGVVEAKIIEVKATAMQKQGETEAEVLQVKAAAQAEGIQKMGLAEAEVLRLKAEAEAKGQAAKAEASNKQGAAEASNLQLKAEAEASGIEKKANAMRLLDMVGRDHEEFKLRLQKEKDIELAAIHADQEIAASRATIVAEALKAAHIEIIGGETTFFNRISEAVQQGRAIDRMVNNSAVLTDIKDSLLTGDPDLFKDRLHKLVDRFGISTENLKNLSITALLSRFMVDAHDDGVKSMLENMLDSAKRLGLGDKLAAAVLGTPIDATVIDTPAKPGKKS